MSARVLITGGAGFVGSGLVRRLIAQDCEVIVFDSMLRGSADNLPDSKNVSVVEGDIRSESDLQNAISHKPNWVVHLAAHHFIPYCNSHPSDTIDVNVRGTQVVLSTVAGNDFVEKLVFASTAAVYGPSDSSHNESEAMAPIDIYGISKQLGEELVDFFHRETGIPALNARLFNVVGPRETNPHLVPDILEQLPDNDHIKLGNLVPKRDYIHVDDVSDGIIAMLASDLTTGSVNIGTGSAYNAEEIVQAIGELLGRKIHIESVAEKQRAGDRPVLVADNQKLKDLNWTCRYDLSRSMDATLKSYDLL